MSITSSLSDLATSSRVAVCAHVHTGMHIQRVVCVCVCVCVCVHACVCVCVCVL